MGKKRLAIAAVVVLLLAGAVAVLWNVLDWPPPRLILKYGLPPAGGPTGRTKVIAGMEFVEVSAGYLRVVRQVRGAAGFRVLGADFRDIDEWIEQPRSFWISRDVVPVALVTDLCPPAGLRQGGHLLCERFGQVLSEREPGTFRLPDYREFYIAAETGAADVEETYELINARGSPSGSMGLSRKWSSDILRRHVTNARFWSSAYPPIPQFRLVWDLQRGR
jgi:hypothetical protein